MTAPERTLFVVDDDEHTRILVEAQLTSLGSVRTFSSAVAAREAAERQLPDLVISDIDMPGMSGLDLLEWLRGRSHTLPVIIVSAFHSDDNLFRALEMGATDFICKPFPLRNIRAAAKNALRTVQPGGSVAVSVGEWTSFEFDSDYEYLRRVNGLISTLIEKKTNKDVCNAIKLAIEEIGTNAIEWGNQSNRDLKVMISYRLDPDRITLIIEDQGAGFNNLGLPEAPQSPEELQALRKAEGKRPGGYGINMVTEIMDEVAWNEAGNRILLTRHLRNNEAEAGGAES